ncbi:MAG: LysR family transcriptional regulator [Burkholderiales bacterium]|nr:LysR family transcriptional regulator [Burkholderiales bacterium]
MSLTIRQLKYFVATAELGQVSQAAHQLNISQSAVTSAIKELESTVGIGLFSRTPGGMELTDAGRRFLNHAYTILSAVDEALRTPALQGTVTGALSLAATYTVIGYFLPHHLERFLQLHPQITVNVHEVNREAGEAGIIQRRFDMGVLLTSNLRTTDLSYETFFGSERRLWVPARHPLLDLPEVTLEHVSREPFIMLTVDEAQQTALRYWSRTPYLPDIRLRTSSVEAVRSMVGNGAGVAILSDMVYRPWSLEGKRIETIKLKDPVPSMDVGLAWKRGIEPSPAMQALREYFRQLYLEPAQLGGHRSRAA